MRIGDCPPKRNHGNHRQIGHRYPREIDRCGQTIRRCRKARGKKRNDFGHENFGKNNNRKKRNDQKSLCLRCKPKRRITPVGFAYFGKAGKKGIGHRAFSAKAAKHVRQFQRHQKCIGGWPCAQKTGKGDISHESNNTADRC